MRADDFAGDGEAGSGSRALGEPEVGEVGVLLAGGAETSTFEGLTSRCTSPVSWAASRRVRDLLEERDRARGASAPPSARSFAQVGALDVAHGEVERPSSSPAS